MSACKRNRLGYIMLETLVAMTILSISSYTIQKAIFQAVSARRYAKDLTLARYFLEDTVARIEMRPRLTPGSGQGTFEGHPDYQYEWEITSIEVPLRRRAGVRYDLVPDYPNVIGKLTVRVYRAQTGVETVGETLLRPGQLWEPMR